MSQHRPRGGHLPFKFVLKRISVSEKKTLFYLTLSPKDRSGLTCANSSS